MTRGSQRIGLPLFLLLFATAGFAQTPTSTLIGRVTTGRKPLSGVTVTVTSDALIGTRTTTTGPTGEYVFFALPAGRYSVTFERAGMQTVTRPAELHLGVTGRANATIEPTEVGESITLTAQTPSILQTPEVVTTIEAPLVDVLPVARSIRERAQLAPGVQARGRDVSIAGAPAFDSMNLVDGARIRRQALSEPVIEEAIEETAVIGGAASAEYGRFTGGVISTVTRSGGNDFSGSIRDDLTRDLDNLLQATLGGPALRDRLWFFGAAAHGRSDVTDQRRYHAKISAGITPSQMLVGWYTHAADEGSAADNVWSAHYDGAISQNAVVEGLYSRGSLETTSWLAKASYFASTSSFGSHRLVAGLEDERHFRNAGFIEDTWNLSRRWTLVLGTRYDDRFNPRLGAVYDIDGRHRASASWGRYTGELGGMDEMTLGYGVLVANNGYFRADAIRRKWDGGTPEYRAIELQGIYRFLGIVTVGGNYTHANDPNTANVFLIIEPPISFGRVSLAVLERYRNRAGSTDVALTYFIPISAANLFVKADLVNAFANRNADRSRTQRFSAGVRF